SATRKPATWTGLASPSITWPMAHSASARDRSWPAISADRTCGQLFSVALLSADPSVEVLTPQPSRRRASSATAPATAAGSSGGGAPPDGQAHLLADAGVVAVEQHGQRLGRRLLRGRHGQGCYLPRARGVAAP